MNKTMKIQKNKSLKQINAFKLDVFASEFIELKTIDDFYENIDYIAKKEKKMIIGDATNILFLSDFDGLIVKNSIKGIEILDNDRRVTTSPVLVYSGEVWDDFVHFAVNNGLGGGIENLVKIPGRVGSGIVQNIGAYGVEIKDLLLSVEAYSFENNKIITLKKSELEFEYRNSFFKKNNGKYFIISAIFKLENKPKSFILNYGNIKNELKNIDKLTPLVIADTISEIRESKLPDYKIIGNCGSFFKNPIISYSLFNLLKSKYKNIPYYKINENLVKIPAAWLIESSGFKGYQLGGAAVYDRHSLIIINKNNASPNDIKSLSDRIINKVFEEFNIKLQAEVIFV